VIKLGSSSLTNEKGAFSQEKLKQVVITAHQFLELGHEVVIVSSGAVACGTEALRLNKRPEKTSMRQAAAAVGQGILIHAYSEHFSQFNKVVAQVLLTRRDFSDQEGFRNALYTLSELLACGVVPIINENDTVSTAEISFGDNDTLSALVACLLRSDYLFLFTDTNGLYSEDPRKNSNAVKIPYVKSITPEIEGLCEESTSLVGTGGMKSKIIAAKKALESNVKVFVGILSSDISAKKLLNGKGDGTYFGESM
jgi:glutamate 5-kinase